MLSDFRFALTNCHGAKVIPRNSTCLPGQGLTLERHVMYLCSVHVPLGECTTTSTSTTGTVVVLDACWADVWVCTYVGVVEVPNAGFGTTTRSWFDRSRPSCLPHGQEASPSSKESHFSRNCPRILYPISKKGGVKNQFCGVGGGGDSLMVAKLWFRPPTPARSDEGGDGGISALGLLTSWRPFGSRYYLYMLLGLDGEDRSTQVSRRTDIPPIV